MSVLTYDARLAELEKDVTVMKQDIIYKLDDTNSAVTMIKGVVVGHERDLKYLINQVKGIDVRLAGAEIQVEGLVQDVRTIKGQQDIQGKDIKNIKQRLDGMDQRLDGMDRRLDSMDRRLDSLDRKFDQVLSILSMLTPKLQQET
jgi:uncharacterized coiled-coil protein SlyX/tetrahydromethanopterin S-methyltransferase subunit G